MDPVARSARFLSVLLLLYESGAIRNGVNTQRGQEMYKPVEDDPAAWRTLYNHINVSLTYNSFGEEVATFPERRPRVFNILLATVKTWTADAAVQFLQNRKRTSWSFDRQRSFTFAVFGCLYVGLAQWALYVSFLTWVFPDATVFANAPLSVKLQDTKGQIELIGQILVDNFVFAILIYFPVFYILKEMMQGSQSLHVRVQTGLGKYWQNIVTDNFAYVALWAPVDIFIFGAPMYWRMPLEHAVSFGWTMLMSAMRGANEKIPETDPEAKSEILSKGSVARLDKEILSDI